MNALYLGAFKLQIIIILQFVREASNLMSCVLSLVVPVQHRSEGCRT